MTNKYQNRIKEFRMVKANDLIPSPYNWRIHPDYQIETLDAAMRELGITSAIYALETPEGLMIDDGHARQELLGDQEVWGGILDDDFDLETHQASLTTRDPITYQASIDKDLYAQAAAARDFEDARLDQLRESIMNDNFVSLRPMPFESLPTEADEDFDVEKAIKQQIEPRIKPGELWWLGRHLLLCGDATSPGDVARLLGDNTPNLMITDPPYGVNYDPAWRVRAAEKGHLSYAARRTGNVPGDDRIDWSEAYRLFPGAVLYAWSPPGDHVILTGKAVQDAGFVIRNQIIWAKPHFVISRGHYSYQHEVCWYGVKAGETASWQGPDNATTVWDFPLDKNVEGGHSTQKPVEAMLRPMRNHAGDVYDPFLGSGTTLIAAELAERTAYTMDISSEYCEVAIARWEAYTGQKAEKVESWIPQTTK